MSATKNLNLMFRLALRDISSAHTGSVLGNAWILVDPLFNIVLTLVFFQFAMKGAGNSDVSYVAWVLPQIIFWTFISNVVNSTVGSVKEYSFLMRHVTFDMRLIVLIKILGFTIIHIVLITIVLFSLRIFFDIKFGLYTLNLGYYFLSMCILLLAIGWIISSLGVFWKDIRNIVSIVIQLEFWISPIFWEPDRFPRAIEILMYINPFYYPIHGYRVSVLGADFGTHFWYATSYYWLIVLVLIFIGNYLFTKLSPQFGDAV